MKTSTKTKATPKPQNYNQTCYRIPHPHRIFSPKTKAIMQQVKWIRPSIGYKLNCDSSRHTNSSKNGMGGVIWDQNGEWIIGYIDNIYMGNHLVTKLLALIQGLHIALTKKLTPLEITMDCKEIIEIMHTDHPSYTNFIHDCRLLLR